MPPPAWYESAGVTAAPRDSWRPRRGAEARRYGRKVGARRARGRAFGAVVHDTRYRADPVKDTPAFRRVHRTKLPAIWPITGLRCAQKRQSPADKTAARQSYGAL